MATQRLTVATLAGDAALAANVLFRSWQSRPDPAAVDQLCDGLRGDGLSLPVVYFCEWADRWSMGDDAPGPGAAEGRRYEATCLTPAQTEARAGRCGRQLPEQGWLAARLREAAGAWAGICEPRVVLVVREVIGLSATDEEVTDSLRIVPRWLSGDG